MAAPELLESADEDGFTPLHLAVIQGNLAMVNLLLSNKADVNVVDNEGHSVVHWATVCGEVEALRAVLAAGAAVTTPDINGGTPLHYAAQMCGGSYESKISVANATQLALEILDILLKHPQSSVDVQDKDGRQPLLWAASAGSAKAVIALVKAGARVESADKDGLTALHCAASRGHTECLDTLISLCGAPTDLIDANGCTGLHYAVTLGHADATARLLDLDADPNRQDRKGRTPAHCGCAKGQFETVRLLKERGANLWLRNAKGDLPVHEAASSGRRELVEWLLELRENQVNTTSNDGRNLLHIAAASDYTDMCKMLLDRGAEINALYRSSKGIIMTPLDCSLQKGFRSTAKFLQSQGGLPAGKLRLIPRRANPFADSPVHNIHPLRYNDKEELQDVSESKKYTVYKKRMTAENAHDAEGDCSCTERTYKREQRFAHTCKRHQRRKKLRRRTSSCGDPKDILCKQEDSSDICRSKSNIELRRAHAREQYYSTSGSEVCEEDLDSCENCCFHKHQKQRVLHRRRARRSKDRDSGEEEKQHKRSVKSTENIVPLAIEKTQTPEPAKEPNVTDEEPIFAEQVTTTVDVHRTPEELESVEKIADAKEEMVNSTVVDEKIEQVVDKVLEMVAEELQATIETKIEENADCENNLSANNQLIEEVKKLNEVKVDDEVKNNLKTNVEIKETPATPLENVTPVKTENEKDAVKEQEEKQEPQPTANEEQVEKNTEDNIETASVGVEEDKKPLEREHEARRSFTLLPSDSADDEEGEEAEPETERKSSFQILKSDESARETEYKAKIEDAEFSDNQVFKIIPGVLNFKNTDHELSSAEGEIAKTNYLENTHDESELDVLQKRFQANSVQGRHSLPTTLEPLTATGSVTVFYDQGSGRKRRMKRRVRSAGKTRSNWKNAQEARQYTTTTTTTAKDQQDSGFEPSPRALKSKIPTPRNIYTAYATRRPIYATLDGRSCSSRFEARKPGDRLACDMSTVTRSIQRNIRR